MAQTRPANNYQDLMKQLGQLQKQYKPVLRQAIEDKEAENAEQHDLLSKINAHIEKLHRDAEEKVGATITSRQKTAPSSRDPVKRKGTLMEDAETKKVVRSIEKADTPGEAMTGVEMTGLGTYAK